MTLTDDYQLQFSEFLSTNYRHALSNIDKLRSLGAKVMHDVDATKMANVFPFKCMRFDRVVYNFPLAGFFPDEPREDEIWLVDSFFEKLLWIEFMYSLHSQFLHENFPSISLLILAGDIGCWYNSF